MPELREALEASWDAATSYGGVSESGNPAFGQCYPTSWVVQHFYPEVEIVEGEVWTGKSVEKHFWNILVFQGNEYHIDFTWRQFPPGSAVRSFRLRDRETLGDGPATIKRRELLRDRVLSYLAIKKGESTQTVQTPNKKLNRCLVAPAKAPAALGVAASIEIHKLNEWRRSAPPTVGCDANSWE
jgi:hypothetical protein